MTLTEITTLRLAEIAKQNGGILTPRAVVEDAQHADSPLHDFFEWNNTEAAQKYREQQARALIRSVEVVITTEKVEVKCVAYVRNPNAAPKEQGYVSVESLRADQLAARRSLTYECDRAAALLERTRHLAVGLGLVSDVDALLASLQELRTKAAA